MEQFWDFCLEKLQQEVPKVQFDTWIKPLMLGSVKDDVVSIFVPNFNKAQTVKSLYSEVFANIASDYFERPMSVNFTAAPGKKADEPPPIVPPKMRAAKTGLNPDMLFENFVVGKANQLPHMAAQRVADTPGRSGFNPLCIIGDVGLGKTHLIQSIGNYLLKQNPNLNILYTHAEQFVNDVIRSYRDSNVEGLRLKYDTLDVLLIDDIQFFVGKDKSQEFFFYTFEALIAANKQIVLTSEAYPQEISRKEKSSGKEKRLDDRLISRFASGVTMVIEPPEVEMRVAILQKKIDIENEKIKQENKKGVEKKNLLSLPDDVAFFIAQSLRSNVRELEGALRTVIAHASFHSQPLSLALAKEALKDIIDIKNRQISVEFIQKTVADYYRIKVADMLSKKRPSYIARPRQIAMYLTKELTQKSLPEIGQLFGGRDHTTVLHAIRKITEERTKDSELNREVTMFEQTLRN